MNRLCDTHAHVFDPGRFPYVVNRKFTPDTATVDQLKKHLDAIGADSVVLVQPSVYGTDHTCLIDALQSLGNKSKGIAVIDHLTSDDAIEVLDKAGITGARINMVVNNNSDVDLAIGAIKGIELRTPPHWHIQLHVSSEVLDQLHDHIVQSPRYFVLDHIGLPNVTEGTDSNQWQRLLQLLKTDRLFVKTSAPYLSSKQTRHYSDLQPFVESLIGANPQRVLWGTNWPHTQGTQRQLSTPITEVERFRAEDDSSWSSLCHDWAKNHSKELAFLNASFLYKT